LRTLNLKNETSLVLVVFFGGVTVVLRVEVVDVDDVIEVAILVEVGFIVVEVLATVELGTVLLREVLEVKVVELIGVVTLALEVLATLEFDTVLLVDDVIAAVVGVEVVELIEVSVVTLVVGNKVLVVAVKVLNELMETNAVLLSVDANAIEFVEFVDVCKILLAAESAEELELDDVGVVTLVMNIAVVEEYEVVEPGVLLAGNNLVDEDSDVLELTETGNVFVVNFIGIVDGTEELEMTVIDTVLIVVVNNVMVVEGDEITGVVAVVEIVGAELEVVSLVEVPSEVVSTDTISADFAELAETVEGVEPSVGKILVEVNNDIEVVGVNIIADARLDGVTELIEVDGKLSVSWKLERFDMTSVDVGERLLNEGNEIVDVPIEVVESVDVVLKSNILSDVLDSLGVVFIKEVSIVICFELFETSVETSIGIWTEAKVSGRAEVIILVETTEVFTRYVNSSLVRTLEEVELLVWSVELVELTEVVGVSDNVLVVSVSIEAILDKVMSNFDVAGITVVEVMNINVEFVEAAEALHVSDNVLVASSPVEVIIDVVLLISDVIDSKFDTEEVGVKTELVEVIESVDMSEKMLIAFVPAEVVPDDEVSIDNVVNCILFESREVVELTNISAELLEASEVVDVSDNELVVLDAVERNTDGRIISIGTVVDITVDIRVEDDGDVTRVEVVEVAEVVEVSICNIEVSDTFETVSGDVSITDVIVSTLVTGVVVEVVDAINELVEVIDELIVSDHVFVISDVVEGTMYDVELVDIAGKEVLDAIELVDGTSYSVKVAEIVVSFKVVPGIVDISIKLVSFPVELVVRVVPAVKVISALVKVVDWDVVKVVEAVVTIVVVATVVAEVEIIAGVIIEVVEVVNIAGKEVLDSMELVDGKSDSVEVAEVVVSIKIVSIVVDGSTKLVSFLGIVVKVVPGVEVISLLVELVDWEIVKVVESVVIIVVLVARIVVELLGIAGVAVVVASIVVELVGIDDVVVEVIEMVDIDILVEVILVVVVSWN